MTRIGVLSDTHGHLPAGIFDFFSSCQQIWHAGDIGYPDITTDLEAIAPLIAVHGNIDSWEMAQHYPADQIFYCEGIKIWITHIGAHPPRYNSNIIERLNSIKPDILICGHSHILRVMHDKDKNVLYMNPGACGKQGFHLRSTALRFCIDNKNIRDLEVFDIPRSGKF